MKTRNMERTELAYRESELPVLSITEFIKIVNTLYRETVRMRSNGGPQPGSQFRFAQRVIPEKPKPLHPTITQQIGKYYKIPYENSEAMGNFAWVLRCNIQITQEELEKFVGDKLKI